MAVKLRLSRMGRKKRPFYRIVAVDSRKRRDGAYIEKIGHYDPVTRPASLVIDHDIAIKWLKEGAIPSDTVRSLFRQDGVMLRWDMVKRGNDQVKIEEAVKEHQQRNEAKAIKKDKPAPKPAPKKEEPKAEAKTEEAPKEEAKIEEAPAEAPTEEAKVEETPKEEPVEEVTDKEAPEEEAEEKKANAASVEEEVKKEAAEPDNNEGAQEEETASEMAPAEEKD